MTSLDAGYRNQALVTRGVAIFTDAVRGAVRRELEVRYGSAWWDVGVWPWLAPTQRKAVAESRANDASRPPEDWLDINHFRAVMLDADANYPLFARYMPDRAQARRALETVRRAKNLLVSHRRSGDTPAGEAFAALQAMQLIIAQLDTVAAEELSRLARNVDNQADRARASGEQPSLTCALCAQALPARAIVIERRLPRHVDGRAFASACVGLFGAPLCAEHVRSLDTDSAPIIEGRVIGHNRGGLIVQVGGSEGFVPRRHCIALRASFLSEADVEALLARQRGRLIQLQQIDQGDGRRPVYREVHPDESVVLNVDGGQRYRAIHFPSEQSLGNLRVYASRPADLTAAHDRRPASGTVIVAISSFVRLEVESPADLRLLASLGPSDLQALSIRGEDVDDDAVHYFCQLAALEDLVLRSTAITDAGLAQLIGACSSLRSLDVTDSSRIRGQALTHLRAHPLLEHLSLAGTAIDDAVVEALLGCRGLRTLDLRNTPLTDASLEALAAFADLEALDLRGTAITDRGLTHVREIAYLRVLELGATGITDAGLVHVGQLSQLGYLGLANTRVTPAGLTALAGMPALAQLDVSSTAIAGPDVLRCAGFAVLQRLSAADVTWMDVPAARAEWLHKQAEQRRRAEMVAQAASMRALGDIESARERRQRMMDVFGLIFVVGLAAVFALQDLQAHPGEAGRLLSWALVTTPAIVTWLLKPNRASYAEAFWIGGLLGGLVVAVGIFSLWRGAPLDAIDRSGPALSVLAVVASALALAWPIRLARPRLAEIVIVVALVGAAVLLASPSHWPADQSLARFWQQYGLDGVEKLVLISAWVWVTWTAIRLLISRLRGDRGRPGQTQLSRRSGPRRWR